jgi:hypothetical protein
MNQDELKQILNYDPTKDEFTWLVTTNRRIKIGDRAGSINKTTGYRQIRINGKLYQEHRLVWLWHHGYLPTEQIDHKNGDGSDNRISNLREATNAENSQNKGKRKNNTSGFTGVTLHKPTGKWKAYITKDGKRYHLGLFDAREEACDAYLKSKSELHTFNPTQR